MGFIHRNRGIKDERQVLVTLTSTGLSLQKKALKFPETLLAASQCSVQEGKNLIKKIKSLRDSLISDNKAKSKNNLNLSKKIKTNPKLKEEL